MTYIQQQFAKLEPEIEQTFKLKLHSAYGETSWLNIPQETLKEIEAILEKEYQS